MAKAVEVGLTEGLLTGYAGKTSQPVQRGEAFSGQASHISLPEGGVYHDEWFTGDYSGGGQELVEVDGVKYTRLYGGGTPPPSILENIGLTVKDVGRYLVTKISELGDQTRLFKDCTPKPDGDWQYKYLITSTNTAIEVTTATESIDYKGQVVHIHPFILCPIK